MAHDWAVEISRVHMKPKLSLSEGIWIIACLAVAVAYVCSVPRVWQCEGVDEIDYLSVAHSLALGKGYTVYGTPHVLYPPLYPFLLSLIIRFAGVASWRTMYTVNALLGVSGWILIATWMRKKFGGPGKWAAWFLLFAYYPWSFSCRYLMSEPLFLPISFGLLILVWRILERNTGTSGEYAAVGLLSLLAGMTRAAAVSLNAALVGAGMLRWLISRRRAGLVVAVLTFVFGVGFFAYWSVRADVVNPDAPESHWRWAKKYLGLSRETAGIIAQGEEVTEISAVFHRRLLFAAGRYGQFITSVVRPPRGFRPAGVLLSLVFLLGLCLHMKRYPWSPTGWYTLVFLGMILKTTWLSNYLRFYIMIAPFLFLFLFEGGAWLLHQAFRERNRVVIAVCIIGLAVALASFLFGSAESTGREGVYQQAVRLAGVLACAAGIVALTVLPGRVDRIAKVGRVFPALLVVLALVHTGGLVALRTREGWKNATLRFRRLDGLVRCSRWLRETGGGTGRRIATLPQVPSFVSGFVFDPPTYDEAGQLCLEGVERVLVSGMLHEVPFFRPAEERRLMAAVATAVEVGLLVEECQCGQSSLYRRASAVP